MRSRKVILLLGSSESVDHQDKYLLALSSKESVPHNIETSGAWGQRAMTALTDQAVCSTGRQCAATCRNRLQLTRLSAIVIVLRTQGAFPTKDVHGIQQNLAKPNKQPSATRPAIANAAGHLERLAPLKRLFMPVVPRKFCRQTWRSKRYRKATHQNASLPLVYV